MLPHSTQSKKVHRGDIYIEYLSLMKKILSVGHQTISCWNTFSYFSCLEESTDVVWGLKTDHIKKLCCNKEVQLNRESEEIRKECQKMFCESDNDKYDPIRPIIYQLYSSL